MAYPQSGGPLNYFMPAIPVASSDPDVLGEMDIGASSGDHGEMLCIKACTLRSTSFTAVGEIPVGTGTAPTVIFKRRPLPKNSAGEVLLSTLQITTSLALGQTITEEGLAVEFAVGDSMEISWTIGVTGTVAGMGYWSAIFEDSPEVIGNNSEVTATI